jgi:hypothetical protein
MADFYDSAAIDHLLLHHLPVAVTGVENGFGTIRYSAHLEPSRRQCYVFFALHNWSRGSVQRDKVIDHVAGFRGVTRLPAVNANMGVPGFGGLYNTGCVDF